MTSITDSSRSTVAGSTGRAGHGQTGVALTALVAALGTGLVVVLMFTVRISPVYGIDLSVASIGMMVAGASLLTGGFLGFLFGIPHTREKGEKAPDAAAPEAGKENASKGVEYRANTNLEEISDWLTKILVGVGLTQLAEIPDFLKKVTDYIAQGFGRYPGSQVFALMIILFFLIVGFLLCYLWTRLYLGRALRMADLEEISKAFTDKVGLVKDEMDKAKEEFQKKMDTAVLQRQKDLEASNLAYRQMNPSPNVPDPTQEALDTAIREASGPMREQIFNKVWTRRSENWAQNKAGMVLTIPMFRAFVKADPENHLYHGQLGFALKDQENAGQKDLEEAVAELTRAIELRNAARVDEWQYYEFARAECRIILQEMSGQGLVTPSPQKEEIQNDLRTGSVITKLKDAIAREPRFINWLQANGPAPGLPVP